MDHRSNFNKINSKTLLQLKKCAIFFVSLTHLYQNSAKTWFNYVLTCKQTSSFTIVCLCVCVCCCLTAVKIMRRNFISKYRLQNLKIRIDFCCPSLLGWKLIFWLIIKIFNNCKVNIKHQNGYIRFVKNKIDDFHQCILYDRFASGLSKVCNIDIFIKKENQWIVVDCFRDCMQGEKFKDPIKATDKRVIITGTTSGIGFETAKELAEREAHVYMACRNMKRCEELRDEIILKSRNKNVHCMECDLSSLQSVRNFVEE